MKRYTRLGVLLLLVVFFEIIGCSTVLALTKAPGGDVSTVQQANIALGGCHTVTGNTILLNDDIEFNENGLFINNAKENITIDANSHKLHIKTGKTLIGIHNANVTLTGNGEYTTEHQYGNCVKAYPPCNITIQNGSFDIGAEKKTKIVLWGWSPSSSQRAYVRINGGDFSGGIAVNNGFREDIPYYDDGTFDESNPPLSLTVSGGKMDSIWLDAAYNSDGYDSKKLGMNKLIITQNCSSLINLLKCYNTKAKISGGKIGRLIAGSDSVIRMDGGIINGQAVIGSKSDSASLIMSGGQIVSDDNYAVQIESPTVKSPVSCIKNGIIKTTKEGAKGIILSDRAMLKISGGTICSENDNGSAGVYVKGGKTNHYGGTYKKKHISRLYFRAIKNHVASIIGYKYGCYKAKSLGRTDIRPHTLLTSKNTKRKYYGGQQLPRLWKGDIFIKYTRRKH